MNETGDQGQKFLQDKYKLSKDPGVVSSTKRREARGGNHIPDHDYTAQIQNYLDRITHLINPPKLEKHPDFDRGRRNQDMLKHSLYDQIIIKPGEIPDSYFQSVIKRHEEEGRPIEFIPEETKKDLIDTLIRDQRESLDIWIDYLSSPDARYPDWFKYYALRSVLVMGRYDKEKKKFFERSKTGKNVGQFPELIRDALSFVSDAVAAKQAGTLVNLKFGYGIKPEERAEFERLLKEGDPNFSRLYAWAIDKITPISEELLQQTKGEWVKYQKGSDPKKVAEALAHYGTGWCIRGEGTAASYLQTSDLEIYFSQDQDGKPTVPRIVIVTRDGIIDEVRGVAKEEHWDPYITDIVEKKLTELPDGQKFKKRVADMQRMTAIHRQCFSVDRKTGVKTYLNPSLTKEELEFLYEIDGEIEGFGYQIPDPRITEIRSRRNPEEDMPIVLGCEKSQIARGLREIGPATKAFVGSLEPGIFAVLAKYNIEHIYTSFPEGRIRLGELTIGGKSKTALLDSLNEARNKGVVLSSYAESMIQNRDFATLPKPEKINTVRLKVQDLGFGQWTTTKQLYERAESFDLELCPAETGLYMRLADMNQPNGEWYYIGMKPMADSGGRPRVFELVRYGVKLWLRSYWAGPGSEWSPGNEFVFRLRK